MLRILVTVEEETGYKDLIRMRQVTVVLSDDVLAQIASHVASQQNMHWTAATPCPYCKGQHDKRLACPKYMASTPPPVM